MVEMKYPTSRQPGCLTLVDAEDVVTKLEQQFGIVFSDEETLLLVDALVHGGGSISCSLPDGDLLRFAVIPPRQDRHPTLRVIIAAKPWVPSRGKKDEPAENGLIVTASGEAYGFLAGLFRVFGPVLDDSAYRPDQFYSSYVEFDLSSYF